MGYVRMRVERDEGHDVYVVHSSVCIEDEADCRALGDRFAEYFVPLGRRVDVIFVVEEFTVAPSMVDSYRPYRKAILDTYCRFAVRQESNFDFSIDAAVKAIKRDELVERVPDVPTGIVVIAHMRARAGV